MSGTVADITDRKMAEIAVREREAAANRFSGLLKQLHKLSIELSRADSFDTLCRMAVERGRSELGFDRLSIWLFNPELTELYGTYGTDEHGTTRDEHGQVWTVTDAWMREFNDYGIPLNIGRSAPLRNEQGEDIGTGWIITAGLQDGKAPIGVLSVDNLIHGEPLHESQIELLGLYGAVVGHLCVRMKAEEALRESQSTARALLNATSDVAFLANADGTLIAFNDAFSKGLGKDPKELTGSYVWNYLPPHVVEKRKPFVYSLIQTGQPMRFEDQLEQGVFDTCIYPIFDVHGKVTRIAIFAHDITQRKQMEMQLLQAQKMESIGRLAGGIAHDFNNLLTAILGYTDLAKEHLPQDEYALGCLEAIHQAGQRAANLTGQLLAFARKQIIEPKIVNLNDLVLNTDKLLRRLIGEDIELVTLPGNDLWHVKIDPGQCEQILVNMAVNARDAMPNGGKLIVETKNVVVNAAAMGETTDMLPGEYVLLAVRDTGVGMEKSVQEHIFEPFFTTKALGKGTGLGLATCHGIVQQNGGYIRLASEPDLGTLFEIYLPRSLQV
ncbi:MAG TPA: ATP-binding protein [Chthonomonadaceae bacterium]|nr:ATP-binding protein [Chthonomonadaceae bacterium]